MEPKVGGRFQVAARLEAASRIARVGKHRRRRDAKQRQAVICPHDAREGEVAVTSRLLEDEGRLPRSWKPRFDE